MVREQQWWKQSTDDSAAAHTLPPSDNNYEHENDDNDDNNNNDNNDNEAYFLEPVSSILPCEAVLPDDSTSRDENINKRMMLLEDKKKEAQVHFPCVSFGNNACFDSEEHQQIWEQATDQLLQSSSRRCRINSTTVISFVQRVPQLETWDCGVACLQMLLQWIRKKEHKLSLLELQDEREMLLQRLGTRSVWTADIVCLLDELLSSSSTETSQRASYLFCSSSLQVVESYGNFDYYQASFENDHKRMSHLFQTMYEKKMPVLQVHRMPFVIFLSIVNRPESVAMVLVDNNALLAARACQPHSFALPEPPKSYTGHYILVVGTSTDSNHLSLSCWDPEDDNDDGSSQNDFCIVAYNPGRFPFTSDDGIMYLAPKLFERAWRAVGTDEDVVFVTSGD